MPAKFRWTNAQDSDESRQLRGEGAAWDRSLINSASPGRRSLNAAV